MKLLMNRCYLLVVSLVVLVGFPSTGATCTTFVLQDADALLCGKNLDWFWSDGIVVINQRGIAKTAFTLPGREPARWVSKYGSVTFNQFGREMPFGGMNELCRVSIPIRKSLNFRDSFKALRMFELMAHSS